MAKHVEGEHPPYDFFAASVPTFIENWPKELLALSMPSVGRQLTDEEERALLFMGEMSQMAASCGVEPPSSKSALGDFKVWAGTILRDKFPDGAFFRLGGRSPKDSFAGYQFGFCNHSTTQLLQLLMSGSERIYEDLMWARKRNHRTWAWLRQRVSMLPGAEFRCFMRDRELVGISQYDCLGDKYFPWTAGNAATVEGMIRKWFDRWFVRACHLDTVVFDVGFAWCRGFETELVLIEINPFDTGTYPGLFNWDKLDFDNSFRYIRTPPARKEDQSHEWLTTALILKEGSEE